MVADGSVDDDCCDAYPRRFATTAVGLDPTNGRFGEVTVDTCRACGASWLDYHVEYEGFTASGRWYRGRITAEQAATLTPAEAVPLLEALPWWISGGSYLGGVSRGSGRLAVDP